jgi:hypothetical protein
MEEKRNQRHKNIKGKMEFDKKITILKCFSFHLFSAEACRLRLLPLYKRAPFHQDHSNLAFSPILKKQRAIFLVSTLPFLG